jgi:hypothetical protein
MKELNEQLAEQMIVEAHNTRHPEFPDKRVYEVYQEEKPYLCRQERPFEGYVTKEGKRAGSDCLVNYDNNRYSIPCEYAGKVVSIREYASRIVLAVKGAGTIRFSDNGGQLLFHALSKLYETVSVIMT